MVSLGGVKTGSHEWTFDYRPKEVVRHVITSGVIPDDKSTQFYPTPPEICEYVLSVASIKDGQTMLEPSAGTGAMISEIEGDVKITAIELTKHRCVALESVGKYEVINSDFLKYQTDRKFDRIVMNPPFSEGRAVMHVEHAYSMLSDGGKLVAVVPMGFKTDLKYEKLKQFDNCFHNTGISVMVIKMEKLQWK